MDPERGRGGGRKQARGGSFGLLDVNAVNRADPKHTEVVL